MKYAFKKINIESPFPTTQCGHSSQTELIYEYKDHLYGRVVSFKDETHWIYHVSLDLLCFTLQARNELQNKIREHFKDENIIVITSATHTHYANSARNPEYVSYCIETLYKGMIAMEYKEKKEITSSFQRIHTTVTGKSRISGYETGNEFLCLLRFYEEEDNFLTILINNCHPTTLQANVPYFSAEYPGYVLRRMEETYPDENFSFIMGPAGDISSRFVRKGQDYEAMCELGEELYKAAKDLKEKEAVRKPLKLDYKEVDLHYDHEFAPIDLSDLRNDLSEREMETIKIGQEMRENLKTKGSLIFGQLPDTVRVASLDFGSIKLIFYPNEIFSDYMNLFDLDKTYLVSYSNGYGPYILPIGFEHITYEMFIDTLSVDTKKRMIETLISL